MQFNPVYLYSNKLDVFTNPLASWQTERYRRVYNRNLKIYRSVDNRIDLQVRNSDQKASNITGSTLVFNLVTRETQDLILQKDCTEQDLLSGKVFVTLTELDLLDLDPGFYNYSIIKEVRETIDSTDYKVTSRIPMYMDSQYGTIGTIEVSGDVSGAIDKSIVVDKFNYTNPFTQGDETPKFYISSIIDARPTINTANSLHTFQFYHTNYVGSVTIQGSIDEQGATPRDNKWSDVATVDLTTEQYKNVTGKYTWFRIKHVPLGTSSVARFTVAQTLLFTYEVTIGNPGRGYAVGNTIQILGSNLGGESPTNNLTITVISVGTQGEIQAITWTGSSYNGVRTFVIDGNLSVPGTLDKVLYR
jgi:hypothetical protein